MFKVTTKNESYLSRTLKDKPEGIIIEISGEVMIIPHKDVVSVESIDEVKSRRTTVVKND